MEGGGNLGAMGAESLREAEEESAGDGIPKAAGELGEMGNKFHNIVQFFTIEKAHRGRNH